MEINQVRGADGVPCQVSRGSLLTFCSAKAVLDSTRFTQNGPFNHRYDDDALRNGFGHLSFLIQTDMQLCITHQPLDPLF